jgi:hypothetical protein
MARAHPKATESENGQPAPAAEMPPANKPPTSGLLSAARRVRDFQKEGRGPSRQLDITLRATPIAGPYFRVWPNVDEEMPVGLLKVKTGDDRRDTYVLSAEIADLPHVAPRVKDGSLVPCITSTGKVYVWARTIPDESDRLGYRIHAALDRVAREARKHWVAISWDNNALTIETPRVEIADEPRWPSGQTLEEMYEIAIKGAFIDKADHQAIVALDSIRREVK